MSKFNDNITKFSDDFKNLINTFLELDDKAPFDNNLLKALQEIFDGFSFSIKTTSKHLDETLVSYQADFKNMINGYYTNVDQLKNSLLRETQDINDKYYLFNNNTIEDIKRMTEENNRKKEAHEIDIDYFIISSDQNIDMFELEHGNNITRYNYQSENALLSYQNSIQKNNAYLEHKLKKANDEYAFSLIDYDAETNNIIEGYNKKIDDKNKILEDNINEFNKIISAHKDEKYKESVDLNDKIRKLSNETSQKTLEERNVYINNQNVNQQEKDQKRNEYQLESQSISREFVLNMTELDDAISKIKSDYNTNLSREEKDLQYRLLDIHKEQDKAITSIYNSRNAEKAKKRLIRRNNKNYFSYSNIERNQSKKTIAHLNKSFSIDNENNNYSKKILELNRSFSIKSINEKELHDNKYYQELNNLDENDLNYKISVLTYQFNKKANLIRLDSTIKTIGIDKEFTKKDTLHQIELEKLSTDIKCAKIDLDSLKKIHSLLHETEDLKHQKRLNYLVVYNLLQIEKNRVLNDYNQAQYKLNVEKENELLNYSTTNIKLKNYKYKQLKYAEIAIEKAILENDIYRLEYKDLLQNHHTNYEIENAEINNQYELDKLFNNILNIKFHQELKSINQVLSTYINAILELKNNVNTLLDEVFSNIIFRPEYLDIISSFIGRLVKIAVEYYNGLSDSFIELEKDVINERLQFEESFKFSLEYENVESEYTKEHDELLNKKSELETMLDGYQNKVNEYNSLIFTIQNQILYIKDPKNFALYNKQSAKKNLALLTNKINNITEEANNNISMMEPLKNEINNYENKIKQLEFNYSNKLAEIKRKQYYSALAYHNLIEDFSSSLAKAKKELHNSLFSEKESKLSAVNYEVIINKKQNDSLDIIKRLIDDLYQNVNTFYLAENKEQETDLLELKENYKNRVAQALVKYNSTISFEKAKSTKTKRILNNSIRNKHNDYYAVEKKCDGLIKKNNNNHNEKSNAIINRTAEATQTFYDEFYAICANQESITSDYKETIKELDRKYREDVNNLVIDAKTTKERLKIELDKFIEKRKILMNDLPEKTKAEILYTQMETKRHNSDLDKNSQNDKLNYIKKRKELNDNIAEMNVTFGKTIIDLNNEHKAQLRKEKKSHNIQLRHIR